MCFGRRLHQGLLVLLLILVGVSTAPGQDVSFEALVPANNCTSLLIRDGLAIGGLSGGGLALWSLDDPNVIEQVTAGRDLSGNYVVDLAWTGAYVWVATAGSV